MEGNVKLHQGGVLQPYRILDLTDNKGYFCSKILAELGADVIKIEPPGVNLSMKKGPSYHGTYGLERSLLWMAFNTSKRCITLNLGLTQGQEIFRQLVKTSHFVVESLPLGYMDDKGLGYNILSELNPQIIMTSITPFGQSGPYTDYNDGDLVLSALSGFSYLSGDQDRAPLRFSVEQSSVQAGSQAAMATLIAHHYRQLSGEGQYIDVSMHECMALCTWVQKPEWAYLKNMYRRQGVRQFRSHASARVIWPCRDGYVAWRIWTGGESHFTEAFINYMNSEGIGQELAGVKFGISYDEVTQELIESWERPIGEFMLRHTKSELVDAALKWGFTLYPVNTPEDLLDNNQLKARDYWVEVEYPDFGVSVSYPGAPFKSTAPMWQISHNAPLIGEHNKEIYTELGLSLEYIAELRCNNVV